MNENVKEVITFRQLKKNSYTDNIIINKIPHFTGNLLSKNK